MQELLNDKNEFGDLKLETVSWGRQNLKSDKPLVDVNQEGIFFHSMGVHQLVKLEKGLLVCQKV